MKKIIIILLSLSTLIACEAQTEGGVQKLDATSFKKEIAQKQVQLIDVRTPNEYQQGHIGNAKLINFYGNDFREKINKLDKNQPVYLYCKSGGRSGRASKVLIELGFKKVYDLKGGYMAWKNQ